MVASIVFGVVAKAGDEAAGTFQSWEWSLLLVPVALLLGASAYLLATGESKDQPLLFAPFARASSSLRRVTGMPGWSIGGIALQMWALLVAGIGFYWDVAWHADLGRDKDLFTPPHLMILIGLLMFGFAALVSVMMATAERAETGWRIFGLHVPHAALPLGILGIGAAIGFPLDDLWHATYGIDVTMWSPTHLVMIGGATMSPIASRLLLAEAGPDALKTRAGRILRRGLNASMLLSLSAFQLEFDISVPQWQALYQPVLIALATSIAFVAARVAIGRFGAALLFLNFLVYRGFFALLVGPVLGHVMPRFPLYIGIAIAVELAFFIGERLKLRHIPQALLAGAFIGTLGLATEWAFSQVWSYHPWHLSLLPGMWVAVALALCGSLVGLSMGAVLAFHRSPLRWPVILGLGLAMTGLLAVPFPRNGTSMSAAVRATPVGEPAAVTDRNGHPAVVQDYNLEVQVTPAETPRNADWFEVMSWQGGKTHATALVDDGGGRYHSAAPVPTGGTWKTILWLTKGDTLVAAPIYMPADPVWNQVEVKVQPDRTVDFVPARQVLLSEQHDAAPTVAIIGYAYFALMFGTVIVLLGVAYTTINRRRDMPYGGGPWPEPPDEAKPRRKLRGATQAG
ncbi:MAG: hypothetical protein QOE92_1379 [Chloroflexota bacterium]|nr:hypothetical protein [Chloroflexota bacterium]